MKDTEIILPLCGVEYEAVRRACACLKLTEAELAWCGLNNAMQLLPDLLQESYLIEPVLLRNKHGELPQWAVAAPKKGGRSC